jgi:hypothetical protein
MSPLRSSAANSPCAIRAPIERPPKVATNSRRGVFSWSRIACLLHRLHSITATIIGVAAGAPLSGPVIAVEAAILYGFGDVLGGDDA